MDTDDHGCSWSRCSLHDAAEIGDLGGVKTALEKGTDIEFRSNHYNTTALLIASVHGHENVVLYLLSKGANIEAQNKEGTNALMLASREGHKKIVEILISKNAKVDTKDNEGTSALELALRKNHKEIVEILRCNSAIPALVESIEESHGNK